MKKGFAAIVIVIVITVAVAIAGFMIYKKNVVSEKALVQATFPSEYQTDYEEGRMDAPTVESATDLDASTNALDETDTDELDTQLNLLNSASLGF